MAASTQKKVNPVPEGFHTVTPYLAVNGAAKALEWYKRALGAKELAGRQDTSDGKIVHARIMIGDSIVMLSDIFPESGVKDPLEVGNAGVTLHLYTADVDTLWKRTVEAGAKVDMPLNNTFWGERYGQITDPFGHSWSMSMQIAMSEEEMKKQREAAMKMFEPSSSS